MVAWHYTAAGIERFQYNASSRFTFAATDRVTTMSSAFEPWSSQFWRPFVQLPLSGAVDQSISPNWFPTNITVKGLGEQAFEQHIVSEVATYGKQLGELTDVVLALVESIEIEDCDAVLEFQVIASCSRLSTANNQEPYAPISTTLSTRMHQCEGLATIPNEVWQQTWLSTEIISGKKEAVFTTHEICAVVF